MTSKFFDKLMHDRIIDTRKYRYIVVAVNDHDKQYTEIRRIEIDKLDTTAALDQWETVKRF